MRIATELRVKALLRRSSVAGVPAYVMRRGDAERGALFLQVSMLDGRVLLFGPAPASLSATGDDGRLAPHLSPDGVPEAEAREYRSRQVDFDPDLWIVEVEDREGRSFLED